MRGASVRLACTRALTHGRRHAPFQVFDDRITLPNNQKFRITVSPASTVVEEDGAARARSAGVSRRRARLSLTQTLTRAADQTRMPAEWCMIRVRAHDTNWEAH